MKINSNTTAVITNNYLLRTESMLSKSSERLSSGYKINNASDNPAGYAISSKMRAQIKALEKATNNADQGIDFIETGEGALVEVQEMIQRLNELAVKAANGTMTTSDRDAIQQETDKLCEEITRIANQTEFNDQPILNGNFEYKGFTDNVDVKVMGYSEDTPAGNYIINGLDVTKTPVADTYDGEGNQVYEYTIDPGDLKRINKDGTEEIIAPPIEFVYNKDSDIITYKNNAGLELSITVNETVSGNINLELPKIGAMRVQIGANEGQVLEMNIPEISLKKMGIHNLDLTTQDKARESIDKIAGALDYTSFVRSTFGAYQNRMEHAINSLDVTVESTESSFSTIVDTDMASEMTEYTRLQVLQQAGTSMLAQANEFPQQALQLLQ